jgi:hypothetical protein
MDTYFDLDRGQWAFETCTATIISFAERKEQLRKFERGLSRSLGAAPVISLHDRREEAERMEAMRNVHFIGIHK